MKLPRTQAQLDANRQLFYQIAGFPGVTGVIDATHTPIQSPGGPRAEIYRNRKTYFSLNVQIVGGPQLEIWILSSVGQVQPMIQGYLKTVP
jgi:hypothetical protein